jgi:hypothetical protein
MDAQLAGHIQGQEALVYSGKSGTLSDREEREDARPAHLSCTHLRKFAHLRGRADVSRQLP